ncbi:GTPase [Oceanobacillus kapialis]|uniref:GTPase n=1 Tax=Oceanobacillus kapialis TaxID=481353 RepID=UPI00384B93C6
MLAKEKESLNELPIEIAMVGHESVGKTALFRQLTGNKTVQESNIKGSTIRCISAKVSGAEGIELVDTPGIQAEGDSVAMGLALEQMEKLHILLLVIKSENLAEELNFLNENLKLRGKRVAVLVTHEDKYSYTKSEKEQIRNLLQVPVVWLNARKLREQKREEILEAMESASTWGLNSSILKFLPNNHNDEEKRIKLFRLPFFGPLMAWITILAMFGIPVFAAYMFSDWLQPISDVYFIEPITQLFSGLPGWLYTFIVGDYGVVTLGWYSFVWAFPVVVLVGLATAIVEETGIQEHIMHTLDPSLRKIGLTGRDLSPVLTGFGCNVVAVLQSRSCSTCTRKSCVSLISFGSACSYQIGATLSIFGVAGYPILFIPYIILLFLAGALHTRLWNKPQLGALTRVSSLPYLQPLTWSGLWWRVKRVVMQFLTQAMPIFIVICVVATLLQLFNVLDVLAVLLAPFLYLIQLPAEAGTGILFSMIRKDGMLLFNQGNGSLLEQLQIFQVFILVYFASTFSSCMVTLYTIRKEFGWGETRGIFLKQAFTSVVSTILLALGFYAIL